MSYKNKKRKIFGTDEADTLTGSSRNDKIYAFDGNDIVNAGSGNDRVYLGSGDDFVDGGNGRDRLYGGEGNDVIIGGRGSDRIYGGDGDDIMTGDAADGSNGWRDRDVFNLGRVDGRNSGNDVITDFDTNNYCGGEWNYDKLSFVFNGNRFNLSEGHDLVWFTYYIEHDGDVDTDAMRDGNDLIFVFERDENGYAKNSIRLEDVIGDDGVTNRRLDWASVDDITNLDFDADVVAEDDIAALNDNDGSTMFGSVLDNDGFDNGFGAVILVSDVSAGTLTLNADGTYSFDVGSDFSYLREGETATVSFTYSVTDIDGDSDEATVTITITGTDDAPVIGEPVDGGELSQDGGVQVIDLLANSIDPEGGDLGVSSVVVVSSNPDRTVEFTVDNETGAFSIDPSQFEDLSDGENETLTLTYFVDDGTGNQVETTATLTVNGANDVPVISGKVNSGEVSQEGDSQTINLLSNASDVDGDDLDVSNVLVVSSNPSRVVEFNVDEETGGFVVDPAQFADLSEGESETLTITYLVDDGTGNQVEGTAEITVLGTDDIPVISGVVDAGSISQDGGSQTIDLLANASDVDGDDLDVVDVTVSSSNGGRTVTFTVDAETGELVIDPAQFADLSDGESETLTVNYLVDDGTGNQVAATATLTVEGADDVPVISGVVDAGSISQDGGAQTIDLLANASDVDGDDLDVVDLTVSSSNGGRTVIFTVDAETGELVIDPAQFADLSDGESETLTVNYLVDDGTGNQVAATATLTVEGADDVPVISGPVQLGTVSQDAGVQTVNLLANASDVDGDALTVSDVAVTSSLSSRSVVFGIDANTGELTIDPAQFIDLGVGESEVLTVSYLVDDGTGNQVAASATLTVMGTNDGPVANGGTNSGDEDTVISGQLTASDIDGDSLTYALETDASNGTVTVNADGSYDYTPDPDFFGTDSFVFSVDDGNGGAATETVTITVNDVIDTAAVPDAAVTVENVSVTIDVLANDIGTGLQVTSATASSGAMVTFTGAVGDGITLDPTGGTVIDFNAYNGTFSYDSLVAGDSIADIITYATEDADGNVTEAATVTRHVVALNEMGTFNTASLDLDGVTITGSSNVNVLNFNGIGVVGGSSSSFFDIGESLTFTFDNPSTNIQLSIGTIGNTTSVDGAQVELEGFDSEGNSLGVVTLPVDGGNFNANLSAAFNHQPLSSLVMVGAGDRFIFRTLTFDEIEGDGYAIVEVQGADDAPVITPIVIEVDEDSAGVTDQSLQISDVDRTDRDLYDVQLVSQPGEGSASVQEDYIDYGNFTVSFDPGDDFQDLGVGQFRDVVLDVVVTDSAGNTNSGGEVVVRVWGTNDGPVANASSIIGNEDTVITGQLSGSDIDGDNLTFSLETGPSNGTVTVNANGSFSYAPAADFFGTDSFTFTVDDGNGGTATETMTINVENVPDPFYGNLGPQTLPNAGRWFIIDFDAQSVTAEARTGGLEPPNPPSNGVVIHLNPNNAEWGVSALSYLNGVVTTRDPSEFSISNYTGGSFTNADGFQMYEDGATDADILWSAVINTPEGPFTYTITLDNIDYADNSSGSISLDGVSVAVEPLQGYNIVIGTDNGETLGVTSQDDYVIANDGDDTITDLRGDDIHFGGDGDDTISDTFGNDVHNGGNGDDTISDTFGDDIINGGDGVDTIRDTYGFDTISGGAGNDYIDAGRDDDTVYGDEGNDTLLGNSGNDLMYGGDGIDNMNGGRDNDTMYGENGNDTMVGDRGDDIMFGGVGDDIMDGGRDNDTINGGEGNDVINSGFYGDNTLNGGAGNDQLNSGFFSNNTLNGGTGDDILTANHGIDTFLFVAGDGHDTIKSFDHNQDKVDLTDFGFTDFSDITALLTDTGSDVLLTLSADQSITFEGVRDITDLTVDDFLI